ncbi:phage protein Gp36 family protein [Algivirga pacifica]|uniref:DUF1320 domain-containing protein n=1 Tax=Algivirga pacifica TaxID=1162670 RepID=A0ABP9D1W6_9BACT
MIRYLIPSDYNMQLQSEIRTFLHGTSDTRMLQSESAALSQVKSYLMGRYDVAKVFPKLFLFQDGVSYSAEDYCFFKGELEDDTAYKVYRCLQDTAGETPLDTDYWEEDDPRDSLVVMYSIDIALYHAYSAFAMGDVPAHRKQRFDEAMEWLAGVAQGQIEADLPRKEITEGNPFISLRYGSHLREDHRY